MNSVQVETWSKYLWLIPPGTRNAILKAARDHYPDMPNFPHHIHVGDEKQVCLCVCLCGHADRYTQTGQRLVVAIHPPYAHPGRDAVHACRPARRAPSRKVLAGQSRMTIRQLGPGRDADRFAGRAGRTVGTFSRGPELWWAKMRGKRNHLLYSFGFMLVVFISAVLFSTASNRPLWIRYEDRRIEYLCVCWCVTMNVQM